MKTHKKTYYIYGFHSAIAAINNPKRQIIEILVTSDIWSKNQSLISKHKHLIVTKSQISDLLPAGVIHQGIAVKVRQIAESSIESLQFDDNTKIAILDQITDPHNVGAILRSAAAFGVKAIVLPTSSSPEESGIIAKTACSALESVGLIKVVNIRATIEYLKKHGFWIIGLSGDAKTTLSRTHLSGKVAIVLGSEDSGIRRLTAEHCDLLVNIPIKSQNMESLNVSNAAAIAFYEASLA